MNATTEVNIVAQFEQAIAECTDRTACGQLLKDAYAADDLLKQAQERRVAYQKIKNERCKQIRADALAPFEDEARRFKQGQKVYFAKRCHSDTMGWDFKFIKGGSKRIDSGQWCRVWQYQPKSRSLWLCKPGMKCEHQNLIRVSFSLGEMLEHGISRTELKLRK